MTRRAMHATLVDDLERARELVEASFALGTDIAFTSDYSRPGFLRMGFLPVTRFTLWAVAA